MGVTDGWALSHQFVIMGIGPTQAVVTAGGNKQVHEIVRVGKVRPPTQAEHGRRVHLQTTEKHLPLLAFKLDVHLEMLFPLGLKKLRDEQVAVFGIEHGLSRGEPFSIPNRC